MIKIIGTGSYLPEKIMTNYDLEKLVDTSDDWIRQRTGISQRRIASDDQAVSDLAFNASKNALEKAGIEAKDLDLIITATSTADYSIPAVSPIIQHKLGCDKLCAAFDVNSVCTGFTTAFITAYGLISSGFYDKCLVIGADIYSKILNWKDRGTCIIFGDGSGAMVLKSDKSKKGILSQSFKADGTGAEYIKISAGGSKNPLRNAKDYNEDDLLFQMDGKKVYEFTILCIPEMAENLIEDAGLVPDDIDWIILHQANLRIIDAVAKKLKLTKDKFIVNIQNYGNTSTASIPIAADEAVRDGRIKEGDKVLMIGFGGGLSWGGFVLEW